jgi:hypothetical protein
MNSALEYRGCRGSVEYSEEDEVFHEAVDDYLALKERYRKS